MNERKRFQGHIFALITTLIWGVTFISTKMLLEDFSPIEIMFFRFALAFIALSLITPQRMVFHKFSREILFGAAGLCGVTLFFLLQNIALSYTMTSNVGVLLSVSPFFTAILSRILLKDHSFNRSFFIGFLLSITGIILILFNGNFILKLSPLGDLLAIICALAWAFYSILMNRITVFSSDVLVNTRKVFLYGLLLLLPVLPFFNFHLELGRFASLPNILNTILLGLGGSAVCFLTWNLAVGILGPVSASVYIYLVPLVTIVASFIFLKESLTPLALAGIFLILLGLFLSERINATQKK